MDEPPLAESKLLKKVLSAGIGVSKLYPKGAFGRLSSGLKGVHLRV